LGRNEEENEIGESEEGKEKLRVPAYLSEPEPHRIIVRNSEEYSVEGRFK